MPKIVLICAAIDSSVINRDLTISEETVKNEITLNVIYELKSDNFEMKFLGSTDS